MKTISLKDTLRKLSVLCLSLPLVLASCGSDEPEPTPNPPTPPTPTKSEVSISNNGLKTKAIAEDATELTFTINLAKKQGDPTEATTATLEYSAEALEAYIAANAEAADFEAIPEAAATFAATVTIAKDATTNTAEVTFDVAQLLALITPDEDLKYVLPVKITETTGENVTINPEKDYILIGVTVDEEPPGPGPDPDPTEAWTFRVKVLLDKDTYENRYYEQDDIIKERLDLIFDDINAIWNGKQGTPYFANEIKYIPVFDSSTDVYNKSSATVFDQELQVAGNAWRGDCDVVVVFDCNIGDFSGERTGAGYGEVGNRILLPAYGNGNLLLPPSTDPWASRTIAHELGHFRGVPDVYSMGLDAVNNPINGQALPTTSLLTCMMNNCNDGQFIWSDYAVYIINGNSDIVNRKDQPVKLDEMYPELMNVVVKRGGAAVANAAVKIYSQPQYGSNPMSTPPRKTGTTDADGVSAFPGNVMIRNASGNLSRAGVLLIEVIDPANTSNKKYKFVPQYEMTIAYFEGKTTDWNIEINL